MRRQRTGLWHHADFIKLWAGQTISMIGSGITIIALPLTAVLVLDATPAQMGIITAIEALPSLLLGLFAGAWIDRRRRRSILIAADIGRMALLMFIPVMATLDMLCIEHLYVVAFLTSLLSLFFNVAYGAYLPSLVSRDQLVEANSKLEISRSIAEIVGPGLAGGLVQLLTAPIAIFADAVSFLVSGTLLGLIRTHEPNPSSAEQRQNIWHEIREGLRLVTGSQLLGPIAGCIGTLSLFNSVLETASTLYVVHKLKIAPGLLGLIFASGSVGFLVGALLPGQVTRRLGLGPAMIAGVLLAAFSDLLVPLASGSIVVITLLLITSQFLFGFGLTIYNVSQVSLRQTITSEHLQGRMNATFHVLNLGVVPLGGILGGILGELVGLPMTLIVAALGEALAVIWLLFSPLRSLRQQPERIAQPPQV